MGFLWFGKKETSKPVPDGLVRLENYCGIRKDLRHHRTERSRQIDPVQRADGRVHSHPG